MIVAADIHFGRDSGYLVDALVRACVDDAQRVLIIAGDLTQRGEAAEYVGAEALLRRVMDAGVRVVCCPGNHDLSRFFGYAPSAGASRRERYLGHITALVGLQGENLGFTRFDTVLAAGDHVIVSLRSVHRRGRLLLGNRVRWPQIRWARAVLDQHGITGQTHRVHFVTHHSLWNLPGDRHRNLHLRGRLELGLLAPYGVSTYINGHNHRFEAGPRRTPWAGLPVYHIQAPSLSRRVRWAQRGYVRWDPDRLNAARFVEIAAGG